MIEQILEQLTSKAIIITPNKRLSAWVEQAYNRRQRDCWLSLDIVPYNTWLQREWDNAVSQALTPAKVLLSPNQMLLLWQQIIEQQSDLPLLNIAATAKTAIQAWQLLNNWCLNYADPQIRFATDGAYFQQWAKKFANVCKQQNFIDSSVLAQTLIQLITQKQLKLPEKIYLLGFLEYTPEQQQLWDVLRQASCEILEFPVLENQTAVTHLLSADTLTQEIQQMAIWAKQTLAKNKLAEVACIIPNFNAIRDKLETTFREVFQVVTTDTKDLPFSMSSGTSLLKTPIIKAALQLLSLKQRIDTEQFSALLRTPFIAGFEQEREMRALLDQQLRQLNYKTISLKRLLTLAKENCPLLASTLTNFSQIKKPTPAATIRKWTDYFHQQLLALGWPGERELNSQEYQALERFKEVLTELSKLQALNLKFNHGHALSTLKQLTRDALFQPQSNPDARIQILGVLEASGIPFTHVWMMHLDEHTWPPVASANPFIPQLLQRQQQMPHASAERELHFCQQVMQQLQTTAKQLLLSYHSSNDEITLSMSPLLNQLTLKEFPQASAALTTQKLSLESLQDIQAPAVSNDEQVRGGSYILKAQSACPFKAFAECRLSAEALAEPQTGLDARDRGILLHGSLENFWRTVKTQSQLLTMNEQQLLQTIDAAVEQALTSLQQRDIHNIYIDIEKSRLQKLVLQFLELEKTRPQFSVAATEQRQTISFTGLQLTVQIDRIDKTNDGDYILIDYKTNKPSTLSWYDDRPDEPQLPLYAVASEQHFAAVSFAQIRIEQCRFTGIAANKDLLPMVKEPKHISYDELQQQWKIHLTALAQEFLQGYAAVTPRNEKACQYCELQTLCRIYNQ